MPNGSHCLAEWLRAFSNATNALPVTQQIIQTLPSPPHLFVVVLVVVYHFY